MDATAISGALSLWTLTAYIPFIGANVAHWCFDVSLGLWTIRVVWGILLNLNGLIYPVVIIRLSTKYRTLFASAMCSVILSDLCCPVNTYDELDEQTTLMWSGRYEYYGEKH